MAPSVPLTRFMSRVGLPSVAELLRRTGGGLAFFAWQTTRIKHFTTILLLSLTVFLAGCSKSDVKYSDLRPATTATISGSTVTVHLGSDMIASACWTIPKARVDGRTVYVVGYRTMREQSREFVVQLPASVSSQTVNVVWVDPDGSHVTVPITK